MISYWVNLGCYLIKNDATWCFPMALQIVFALANSKSGARFGGIVGSAQKESGHKFRVASSSYGKPAMSTHTPRPPVQTFRQIWAISFITYYLIRVNDTVYFTLSRAVHGRAPESPALMLYTALLQAILTGLYNKIAREELVCPLLFLINTLHGDGDWPNTIQWGTYVLPRGVVIVPVVHLETKNYFLEEIIFAKAHNGAALSKSGDIPPEGLRRG
ncbi:hypothetical protein CspeluHIS016_0106790 [Cutaneotrichosporon spelunceum]|uniref:Uncharacterized protein n=1 Tax=Cutaneotrichosporon spelunceum TaxID=1672016 RepID=A0AAD3TP16_9TREE|nr:hypothetical protein CspeluHIS016_0106790 [Cutaneotrichosporon spelunceum]